VNLAAFVSDIVLFIDLLVSLCRCVGWCRL